MHAYMADCTAPSERSRTFSLSLGLLFIGMAFGPTLGSILIRESGSTLSVFYLATAVHLGYALMVWTVLPESLGKRAMQAARRKKEDKDDGRTDVGEVARFFSSPSSVTSDDWIFAEGAEDISTSSSSTVIIGLREAVGGDFTVRCFLGEGCSSSEASSVATFVWPFKPFVVGSTPFKRVLRRGADSGEVTLFSGDFVPTSSGGGRDRLLPYTRY